MNWNLLHICRILLDRRVTATRVLRELRAQGKRRVPAEAQSEIDRKGRPGWRFLDLTRRWLAGEMLTRHNGQWVLNSFLPPFPGRAFDRMFENLLSGRRLSPVSAFLAVTADCPYSCWHCSLKGRRPGRLETKEWLSVIEQLHGLGASIIGFTGGEPLCRDDLCELIQAASARGAATILFTCGASLDGQWAARLREAGLWALCVSLDHPEAAEFDRLRGKPGAREAAHRALRISRRHGFYTMIGAVATRRFVEQELYRPLHRQARELGCDEFRIVEPMPCGRLSDAPDGTLLAPEMTRRLREFHVQTNRRGRAPKVCAFNQIESPEMFGCGGGTQHLFIDPAGEVCPCDFMPLSFGNAAREPVAEIWLRMNAAMGGAPRRHCFIQRHHDLIAKHAGQEPYPLPPETSERICAEAGTEPLPDYFAMVTQGKEREESHREQGIASPY